MSHATFLRKTARILGKLAGVALISASLLGFSSPAALGERSLGDRQHYGRSTGLKLPRFASLKVNSAHLRRGPGTDYPILWEITRRGLPVRIIGEYGHWRRVELHDGSKGWMHRVLLSGRRTALLLGAARRIRAEPYEAAAPVAEVGETTPLRLNECVRGWCLLEGSGVRGWAPQARVWGANAVHVSGR